jgi:hypothetical protein
VKPNSALAFFAATLALFQAVKAARSADIQSLSESVAKLPEGSAAERIKKCLLGVDVEFARSAIAAGDKQYADTLSGEAGTALSVPADQMGRVVSDARQMSVLAPVREAKDNPYITLIAGGAAKFLSTDDEPFGKSNELADSVDPDPQHLHSREVAMRMQALMWLYFNAASPMRGDIRILRRLFLRQLAYADAIDLHAGKLAAGKSIFDDFAIGPASCAMREFSTLLPAALLPSQKAQLDRAMRKAADKMDGKAKSMSIVYANIDLALSFELLNFGLYLHDQSLLDRSESLLSGVEGCIFPAGGVAYLGAQNQCPNYQDTISTYLADINLVTGDPRCLDWLKRMLVPGENGPDSSAPTGKVFASDPGGTATVGQLVSSPLHSIKAWQLMLRLQAASAAPGRTAMQVMNQAE